MLAPCQMGAFWCFVLILLRKPEDWKRELSPGRQRKMTAWVGQAEGVSVWPHENKSTKTLDEGFVFCA